MIIIISTGILEKYTMHQITLGNCSCISLLPAIHGSICSFWKNISGHFVRFTCNHSYGYALITGILPCTLRARFAHVKSFLRFYRRSVQTTATDGGSVDFAGALYRPDSLTDFIKYSPIVCIPIKYLG